MEAGFLEQRLAAATAVPPSQRSPDVAAFIECCRLQQEVADKHRGGRRSTRRKQALADLKLARANILGPSVIGYRPAAFLAAWDRLRSAAAIPTTPPPGVFGSCISALLDADLSIETVLLVAAVAMAIDLGDHHMAPVLPVYNSLVERLQVPAVAARLRQELEQLQADLPHSLLSFEELLASFVWLAYQKAADLSPVCVTADVMSAFRTAGQLLPSLTPEKLFMCFVAITAAGASGGCIAPQGEEQPDVYLLRGLLGRAQEQGSDFTVATCGYHLVTMASEYGPWACRQQARQAQSSAGGSQAREAVAPPSAFWAGCGKPSRRMPAARRCFPCSGLRS